MLNIEYWHIVKKDNDVEVTKDDQMMINQFGRLTLELKELEAEYKDEEVWYTSLYYNQF